MTEEEEEFYDSESEPSFVLNDTELSSRLDNLSICADKNSSFNSSNVSFVPIYAVQFINKNPSKNSVNSTNGCSLNRLFINQENAMKLCKQDPDNRRFKVFRNFHEAYAFSYESHEIESGQAPSKEQIKASLSLNVPENKENKIDGQVQKTASTELNKKTSTQDAEKLPFSAPKKPEVNAMRAFIEKNNFDLFRDKAISNPRFLITAGDAPVIYQEAFRYNALHVCAKENRHNICQLILNLLNNTSYLQKMYRNDTLEQSRARSNHLLDLYLNTPEKGLNETPLHFATKFGSYEVARLLMAFDICCKNAKNKNGKTPDEIICTKATNQAAKDNYERIKSLFEECYYVPLFRDDEKGDVLIDKPSPKLVSSITFTDIDSNRPAFSSPLKTSLSQAQRKLAGYAGPVSPTVAYEFYERLKSPAKLRRSPSNLDILRGDEFKGYERILRKITDEMSIPWCEYWGFLDSYCNLKSKEGLDKLEIYLEQKKVQSILEFQIKSSQMIINDQLNNNNNKFALQQQKLNLNAPNENQDQHQLLTKLDYFIKLVNQLKLNLELKENTLSHKYEKFVKTMLENQSAVLTTNNTTDQIDLLNDDTQNESLIYENLSRYMSVIVELSRLDKTSKCYFNLYKTSKTLLDLLNCQKLFDNFYLSPVFKRVTNTVNNPTNKPLTNTTNLTNNTVKNSSFTNIRGSYQIRKPSFSDSDDEDDEKDSKNDEDNDQDEYESIEYEMEKNFNDADDSILEHLKTNNSNNLMDELELVTLKMNSNFLNGDKTESGPNANPFKIPNDKEDDSEFKLNDVNTRQPLFSSKNFDLNREKNKLFMFGDTPSKLDRAVYLAIQNVQIDTNKYKFLDEWYNYMKRIKHSDMQKWKTPMRQQIPMSRFKNLN